MIEILFYETEDGRCPLQEYLESLEPKLLAKTLRTKQGTDITRVLYFFFVGNKAVLTNGFIKKTQKTPKSEIELAKKYKADYERRNQL
ncbi:MAG: type II toxin-antitoxin system RelE/ParE family toxin [Lachnospiraceae bacterium]